MSLTTRCRRCGREFELDRRAIVAGPAAWRLCPACRGPWGPPGLPAGGLGFPNAPAGGV